MTKTTIIFALLLFFLNSVAIPNYVSAMGSSAHVSDQAGWLMVGGLVLALGIWYLYANYNTPSKEPQEDKKENKQINEKVVDNSTPSGELVFLKW